MSLAERVNFAAMVFRDLHNPAALLGSMIMLRALWPAINAGFRPEGIENEED